MIVDPPVVYRVCSDDVLREQIEALETDSWLAERMFQARGETMPDGWSPESEVRRMDAAGANVVALDVDQTDTTEPPWWNLWLTTLVKLDLDRKIHTALTAISDETGAPVAELWKVYDRLVDIRDPKRARETEIDPLALAKAAKAIAGGAEVATAAELAGIHRRKFERYRKARPLRWEQIQRRVADRRKRSDR